MSLILSQVDTLLEKVLRPCSQAFMWLGVLGMVGIAVPIVLDVLGRFFFSMPLPGTLELTETLMAIVALSALAFIQGQKSHINVDLFYMKFSPKKRAAADVWMWGSGFVAMGLAARYGSQFAINKYIAGEQSLALGIPIWVVALYLAISIGLLSLRLLQSFVQSLNQALIDKHYTSIAVAVVGMLLVFFMPELVKMVGLGQSKPLVGLGIMAYLFILLFLGMPLGIAMTIAGLQGLLLVLAKPGPAYNILGMVPYSSTASFVLTVIPMFILMGELALYSNISQELFRAASVWLGRLPGGLGVATLGGCAGFAAVCGDSLATAVTMSSVALPEMRKQKYDAPLACATLAAGGTLGILIPPSVGFIFYAIMTEESVGKLFMAGVIPGLLLTFILMAIMVITALIKPEWAPRGPSTTWSEKFSSLWGVLPMLLLVTFIMGGMLSGMFSPTEGGAMGAFGTLLYGLARRRLSLTQLLIALKSSSLITCKILFIMMGVGVLGYFLASSRLPAYLTEVALSFGSAKYMVLTMVIILYLLLGCVMNVIPMLMLTMPAIFPVIVALGFDPIWFGVISVILMELGQLTPPIGVIVYAISSIATDVPMLQIFMRLTPIFLGMLLCILLVILFPGLATWLPSVVFN